MRRSIGFAAVVLCLSQREVAAQPFGAARSEFRVNFFTTLFQAGQDVVFADDGSFVVAFNDDYPFFFSNPAEVLGQRFSASGQPLSVNFRINTYTLGDQLSPRLARGSGAAGAFVVVWADVERRDLFGQRFGASGTPLGPEFRVNSYTTNSKSRHAIAADQNGSFVVVWQGSRDNQTFDIWARRFSAAGVPLTEDFRVNTFTSSDQFYPSVSRDSAGAFVVVWQSDNPSASSPSIFGQVFLANGSPLAGELQVDTSTGYMHFRPSVTMDSLGFAVTWEQGPLASPTDIFLRRFNAAGAALTPPIRVNTSTTGGQSNSRVASAAGLLVVWQSIESGELDVHAQRFGAAGEPAGGQFRVNSAIAGNDQNASVAGGAGRYLVAWSRFGDVVARELCETLAGDADGSGALGVADILYLINHIFAGGPAPLGSGDVDGNGATNVADILYLINHLFAGGPAPACA